MILAKRPPAFASSLTSRPGPSRNPGLAKCSSTVMVRMFLISSRRVLMQHVHTPLPVARGEEHRQITNARNSVRPALYPAAPPSTSSKKLAVARNLGGAAGRFDFHRV